MGKFAKPKQKNIKTMKYYIAAKESKRGKDGRIAVKILFRNDGREFVVSTGIYVSTAFSGLSMSPKETNYRAKLRRLTNIIDEVEAYLLNNAGADHAKMKRELAALVSGEAQEEKSACLADYIEKFADTKSRKGTADLYQMTARKVREYDGKAVFGSVDKAWLDGFDGFMGDASVNYKAIMLRNIRTVFNWAIDNELTSNYPFRRYKIKQEKVAINNISVEQLRAIRDYPLDDWREMYRDLFMLTFYLCGINPIDLLSLKPSNVHNGRIRYRRAKTGRLYDIPIPEPAQEIISRYKGKKWLLCPLDTYGSYEDFSKHWNDTLKKIGPVEIVPDKVGRMRKCLWHPIAEGMTVYTARYTFASIGAELEIPRETIALCLGHSWADVTSHYIAYNTKRIDDAVRKIIDYVNSDKA